MMKYEVTSKDNFKKSVFYFEDEALAFAEHLVENSSHKFPAAFIRTEKDGEPVGPIHIVRPKLKLVPKARQ